MDDMLQEYFSDPLTDPENESGSCCICGSDNNIKKCICHKCYCEKCLAQSQNYKCKENCYLFNNDKNTLDSIYNISKYPLPKNFEAMIHFISVDWVRTGIVFGREILDEGADCNCPPYKLYYLLENMSELYSCDTKSWITFFDKDEKLKPNDNLLVQLKNKELKYFLNGKDLGGSFKIKTQDKNENDMYLIVHRRNKKSQCELIYIYDLD